MNIYLVNADRLHFSVKQLGVIARLLSCADLGGILEGVVWVRDNDGDIIILASDWRPDSFFQLLPRRYMPHNIYALQRAADYLMACGTDWLAGPSPLKVGWGVTAGRCGNSWIMCTDGDYINQKAVNVNQGKLNIRYDDDYEYYLNEIRDVLTNQAKDFNESEVE